MRNIAVFDQKCRIYDDWFLQNEFILQSELQSGNSYLRVRGSRSVLALACLRQRSASR